MALNLNMDPEPEEISEYELIKSFNVFYSDNAIIKFDADLSIMLQKAKAGSLSETEIDSLEKAIRDRSHLVKKTIVRSDGRRTTKWVRPTDAPKKENDGVPLHSTGHSPKDDHDAVSSINVHNYVPKDDSGKYAYAHDKPEIGGGIKSRSGLTKIIKDPVQIGRDELGRKFKTAVGEDGHRYPYYHVTVTPTKHGPSYIEIYADRETYEKAVGIKGNAKSDTSGTKDETVEERQARMKKHVYDKEKGDRYAYSSPSKQPDSTMKQEASKGMGTVPKKDEWLKMTDKELEGDLSTLPLLSKHISDTLPSWHVVGGSFKAVGDGFEMKLGTGDARAYLGNNQIIESLSKAGYIPTNTVSGGYAGIRTVKFKKPSTHKEAIAAIKSHSIIKKYSDVGGLIRPENKFRYPYELFRHSGKVYMRDTWDDTRTGVVPDDYTKFELYSMSSKAKSGTLQNTNIGNNISIVKIDDSTYGLTVGNDGTYSGKALRVSTPITKATLADMLSRMANLI